MAVWRTLKMPQKVSCFEIFGWHCESSLNKPPSNKSFKKIFFKLVKDVFKAVLVFLKVCDFFTQRNCSVK